MQDCVRMRGESPLSTGQGSLLPFPHPSPSSSPLLCSLVLGSAVRNTGLSNSSLPKDPFQPDSPGFMFSDLFASWSCTRPCLMFLQLPSYLCLCSGLRLPYMDYICRSMLSGSQRDLMYAGCWRVAGERGQGASPWQMARACWVFFHFFWWLSSSLTHHQQWCCAFSSVLGPPLASSGLLYPSSPLTPFKITLLVLGLFWNVNALELSL